MMIFGKNITNADYAEDQALPTNTHAPAETLLHSREQATRCIGLHLNSDKTEFTSFDQSSAICWLNGSYLKLVEQFVYFGSNISFTENDVKRRLIFTGCVKIWSLS